MNDKARYIMVGGFLGAGKTTAILAMARLLRERGRRVGLITNDQSFGLVDTAMLASHGFSVEEITGGCFCCKFNSLVEASEKLTADARPDVFIAEPVGSCTDLKATVDYPLRRLYGDDYSIAPLSVLVDPVRAAHVLGIESGKSFSRKVIYIYRKQLEEADLILVNKIDAISPQKLEALVTALTSEFPQAHVLPISARHGIGLNEWVDQLDKADPRLIGAMPIDYDTYADGEALLGWLNCTLAVNASLPLDGNALLLNLIRRIQGRLRDESAEVAHLKLTLAPDEGSDLAVANLVRTDAEPDLSHMLQAPIESGQLILNLRAEADPDLLKKIVIDAVDSAALDAGADIVVEHIESFRPGRPTPTHRLENA